MILRVLFTMLLLTMLMPVHAAERKLIKFDLLKGKNILVTGKDYTSEKPHTWSKGALRSYLELSCQKNVSGKVEKLYSTIDHFSGLRVTHKLSGENIEIKVVRILVKPRLIEIRALPKNECKDMAPILTITTESYLYPAIDGNSEARLFGEGMTFRSILTTLVNAR